MSLLTKVNREKLTGYGVGIAGAAVGVLAVSYFTRPQISPSNPYPANSEIYTSLVQKVITLQGNGTESTSAKEIPTIRGNPFLGLGIF